MLPEPVAEGRHLRVISVSAPEPAAEPAWLERGLDVLRSKFEVSLGEHLTGATGYLSANPRALAADLHAACADAEVDGIICAAGGSNANRLLRELDFDLITDARKPIVGVSNPTVLLNAITERTALVTLHGPAVVWDFGAPCGPPRATLEAAVAALAGRFDEAMSVGAEQWVTARPGAAEGRLVAINLTGLQTLIGTPYMPDLNGAILAWEDVGKGVDRLDMMLTHLSDAGHLDGLAGMVVGELENCPPEAGVDLQTMLDEVVSPDIPILREVPFGHTPLKATLPIGAPIHLDATQRTLRLA